LLQLLSIPLALWFLVGVVAAIAVLLTEWHRLRWRSLTPLGTCLGSFFLALPLVHLSRHLAFLWALPSYEAVVKQIETGAISVSPSGTIIEGVQARMAFRILAARTVDGSLTVEFITELGFPVLHSGYLYSSKGSIDSDPRWPIHEEVRKNWYFISD
jgi:hypothetical protein